MMKNRKGITLTALVVTIILMILIAAIAITLAVGENGLFSKAKSSNYNQAVGELYDRTFAEVSYLIIPDKVDGKDDFNFEKLYTSRGFTKFYEIRNGNIWDRSRNLELVKKEEFENSIRDKFKQEGKESAKPIVNPITNEDRKISGSGKRGATIYVNAGGIQYTGTKITVTQKEKDKIISVETIVDVVKAKLEQVTIDEVLNTNTSITGSARPGADITLVIGSTEYTGKADISGRYNIPVGEPFEGSVVSGKQSMLNKLSSDVVTTIVGMAKSEKPTANEVKSNHTEVTGRGIPNSRITVILPNGTDHVGYVSSEGEFRIMIPKQEANSRITVIQKTPRRLDSEPLYIDVVRAVPAPNPTVNEMDTDDTKVTGKGVPNSNVFVKIPGKMERYITVNGNGDWELETGLLDGEQEIIVYQELPDRPNSEEIRRKVKQLPALAVPRIDYVDSSHDRVWGWAEPNATVDVHVHGIVRQNVTADGSGRWSQHIGQERGNARIEVRQMKTGRPWSEMAVSNVVQLPALGNPSIDQMNTAQDHIYGWATPGATVKVHVHGVFIRDIGTDPSRKMVDTFRIRERKCHCRSTTNS